MSNDFRLTVTCEGVALRHKEKELKEDDVASWARFTIHTRGVPNPSLWYTDASEARKAKTQVGRIGKCVAIFIFSGFIRLLMERMLGTLTRGSPRLLS